ncbi:MAG: hypothetical protein IIB00_00945 [candidate division Zixibacteria bacterium]|nr:hypothetical protein [candidate division Zixibacteria bacterium]
MLNLLPVHIRNSVIPFVPEGAADYEESPSSADNIEERKALGKGWFILIWERPHCMTKRSFSIMRYIIIKFENNIPRSVSS